MMNTTQPVRGCAATLYAVLAVLPWCLGVAEAAQPFPTSLAPMLERVSPGVVNIATEGRARMHPNLPNDPFFQWFFQAPLNQPRDRKFQSLGSGVIVDAKRGLVLTNHHVIDRADQITVTLLDGRALEGEIIGSDPDTDVAVVRIEPDNLSQVPVGDSDQLRQGDFVVAIGNPFGLNHTVTQGVVSALGRSGLNILNFENLIQTDASINPGNSGGALVDLEGRLVGINTAVLSSQGRPGNIGIGFAIPVNQARQIMEQLLEHGEVKRGFLGVLIEELTEALAEALGLDTEQGAFISGVYKDSAAEQAGILPGDVIIALNGDRIDSADALRNRIGLMRPGDAVEFEVYRDGERLTLSASLRELTDERRAQPESPRGPVNPLLAGLQLEDGEVPGVGGVRVVGVQPGSPAWRSGLREGDLVVEVNRARIRNVQDFLSVIDRRDTLFLQVLRGDTALVLLLR